MPGNVWPDLRQVAPGSQIAHAQVVDLRTGEVRRPGQQIPLAVGLTHAEDRVAGSGRKQVGVEHDFARVVHRPRAHQLDVLAAFRGPRAIPPAALFPRHGVLAAVGEPVRCLLCQRAAQRVQVAPLIVVVGALGAQMLTQARRLPLAHPRVVVIDRLTVQLAHRSLAWRQGRG
jgi:hypothetical protein